MASWNFPAENGRINTSKNKDGGRVKLDYSALTGDRNVVFGDATGTVTLKNYSSTAASTAVSNTTTETTFTPKATIPANVLNAGDTLRFRLQGIATSTNSTDTLRVRVYLGSVVVWDSQAVDAANNNVWMVDGALTLRSVGSSGTVVGSLMYQDLAGAGGNVKHQIVASTSIDTTAALELKCTATWSVASASNSCRLDYFDLFVA